MLGASLQEAVVADLTTLVLEDRENGANADVDVDVGRAIKGVKQQQVFALRVVQGHGVHVVHLFRGHARQVAAPFVGFDQHLVGDDVQLLLDFALHVLAAGGAQHVTQSALVDADGDALASTGDHFDEQAQLRGQLGSATLLFDQVLREADAFRHVEDSKMRCEKKRRRAQSCKARETISRTSSERSVRAATRAMASRAAER